MNKLCHWILNGKGRGKRYLLLLAATFAFITSFIIFLSWNIFLNTPLTQQIINSIPDLKLQNGVLIEPMDTYQKISWSIPTFEKMDLKNYDFIINTKNENIDIKNMPSNSIYLTSKNIYLLNDGILTVQSLKNFPDFKITQGQLNETLKKGNLRFSIVLFLTLSIVLFITLYIWSLIYALLSYILTSFIPSEKYPFSVRRRLSVVSLICAYILTLPLSFLGVYISLLLFFICVLIIMSLLLSYLPKIFIVLVDK